MRGDGCRDRDILRFKSPSSYSLVVPQDVKHELEPWGEGQCLLGTELPPQQDTVATRTYEGRPAASVHASLHSGGCGGLGGPPCPVAPLASEETVSWTRT